MKVLKVRFWNELKPYVLATVVVWFAYLLKCATHTAIHKEIPFLLFFSAVGFSGMWGGFTGALYATGLSAFIASYYFLPPEGAFLKENKHQYLKIALYVIDAMTLVVFCARLKKSTSESKRAQNAEKTARDRLTEVLEYAPVMIWSVNKEGFYTVLEGKLLERVGLQNSLGKNHFEVFRDNLKAMQNARRALSGEAFQAEGEFNGRVYSTSYVPVRSHEGLVVGFSGVSTDITALKEAQTEILIERDNFRNLYAQTPEIVCILKGPHHIFEFVNEAHIRVLGFDATGKTVRQAQPESVEVHGVLDSVYQTGETVNLRKIPITVGNKQRYFDLTYAVRRGVTGQIDGVVSLGLEVTDEVEASRALEESEAKFRTITEVMPQMVWATLPNGFYEYFNARWYDFTGKHEGLTAGSNWQAMLHPEDRERASQRWAHSLKTGEDYQIEYRLRHHSGQYRWILDRALPVRNPDGQIIRWMGTCTDIQDQKLAETRLIEVLESMGDAFISVDRNWIVTRVNAHQVRLSGRSREEQIGRSFLKLFPYITVSGSIYWDNYQKAMHDRLPVRFEDYYAPLNLWTAVTAYPTPDGGMSIFFQDVTAQKNVQRLIEVEKQKLEAVFLDSPAAMALLRGPNFVFEKINRIYAEILPIPEIVGKTFLEAIPELKDQPFVEMMKKVFETGVPCFGKEALVRYGRYHRDKIEDTYFDFNYSRVLDGDGKPYGIYIHAMEVTDKVMNRKNLENLSADLKDAVLARDEFLSIASHELKTPLTSLKLQSQTLKRQIDRGNPVAYSKERIDQFADQTDKQVTRLTRLVDDMLDIARIRSGKLTLFREHFDLGDLVKESVSRMHLQFSAAGCGNPQIAPSKPAFGHWDRMRMEQVLNNIFTNAIRYGKGKPVEIEMIGLSDDRTQLVIRDCGIGIPKDAQSKIFDRFERAIDANEVSGLGLGLFITRQIILAHGGRIWVESEPGVGSSFFIELPNRPFLMNTGVQ